MPSTTEQQVGADFSFKELRNRIHACLEENNLQLKGSWSILRKAIFIATSWILVYSAIMTYGPDSFWIAAPLTLVLVVFTLAMGLGVMHDASHRAFSRSQILNNIANLTLTFMGGSTIIWYQDHVISHHGHTNIPGKDPDIHTNGIFRFSPSDQYRWFHRFQHLYAVPLYCTKALIWVWYEDMNILATNKYKLRGKRLFMLFMEILASRASHIMLFILVPYLFFQSWAWTAAFYLSHWLLFSISMVLIFEVAHVANCQEFFPEQDKLEIDWALHQLLTTANFKTNAFMVWLVGGLNQQIEHHIFPTMTSIHYPLIRPIVMDYANEHGVPYLEYPKFRASLAAHFRHLKNLSKRPAAA
ncbi:MAG: acyl-CoA desaturase [Acidobacteria bacterium]|nr:acyl-CoA desaturase [Acidobacteriota bacterium]